MMPRTKNSPAKKGRRSWDTTNMLQVADKEPGYVYRWERNDEQQIQRQKSLGWEVVNSSTSRAQHENPGESTLDTGRTYREMVLMRLPEDDAEDRRAYFSEQSTQQIMSLKREAQAELDKGTGGKAGRLSGAITIE